MTVAGLYYFKKYRSPAISEQISTRDAVAMQWNGLSKDRKRVEFSFILILFPASEKGILYFMNPLLSFSGKTLENSPDTVAGVIKNNITPVIEKNIEAYINLPADHLRRWIDLLGGVEMYFDPHTARDTDQFHKSTRNYILNGEEALDYAGRPREPIHYVQRISFQQSLFLTMLIRIHQQGKKWETGWLQTLYQLSETNLSMEEFRSFFQLLLQKNFQFNTFEASGELVADDTATQLKFKRKNSQIGYQEFETRFLEQSSTYQPEVRLEILNGTAINGLARRAKVILNYKNFMVLSTDNAWRDTIQQSIVINRSGNTDYAYRVAHSLKIKKVYHIIRKQSGLDVTVVLGENTGIKP